MRICANYPKLKSNQTHFHRTIAKRRHPSLRQWITSSSTQGFSLPYHSTPSHDLGLPNNAGSVGRRASSQAAGTQEDVKTSAPLQVEKEDEEAMLLPPKAQRQHLQSWISLLARFLPAHSRDSATKAKTHQSNLNDASADLLVILHNASGRRHVGTDLLAHLVSNQNRSQDALTLVNMLLDNISSKLSNQPERQDLSNLSWPDASSLDKMCSGPISAVAKDNIPRTKAANWAQYIPDPRYANTMSTLPDRTMTQLWKSLGAIIIEAADMEEEKADVAMRFVYRVIAQIHKLGLVPENVYSYNPSDYPSSTPRPPIMHLLSSRILTTLSDAVWRAHSDEVIAKAASSGIGYKDLGLDPPGGRFRLKVMPLGPQVWLEFVLWCCVDGGFTMAGTQIIERLQQRKGEPWFALNWMLPYGSHASNSGVQGPAIDWGRVKLRHGGTVGQIEGYSREQPFAVMDFRTISAEVVLALVDSLANSVNVGLANRGSSLDKVQNSIKGLVGFLEPHRLPAGYFDFLAVRLHQTGSFDPDRSPDDTQRWTEALLYMRSLESANPRSNVLVSLDLEPILTHSELLNGLFHQSLDAFVVMGDVRRALDVFAQIQQLVDASKLRSIGAFLGNPPQNSKGFFSSRTATINEDFVLSHGQLPLHKLAAFLDLLSDSNLIRLGNWLLYSEDVDGPLIPKSSYQELCIAPALLRFAAVSKDASLAATLAISIRKERDRSHTPSAALLRAFANTDIALSNLGAANDWLLSLARGKAGGSSPGNLVSLVGYILALEIQTVGMKAVEASTKAYNAEILMGRLLQGIYDGGVGMYRQTQRDLIERQISSILRILECIPGTSLSGVADTWRSRFEAGNNVSMYTSDFNILMAAIVETKGAKVGRMIWDLFCEDPREKFTKGSAHISRNLFVPGLTESDEGERESRFYLRKRDDRPSEYNGHRFLPIVEVLDLPNDSISTEYATAEASNEDSNGMADDETMTHESSNAPPADPDISIDWNSNLETLEPRPPKMDNEDPKTPSPSPNIKIDWGPKPNNIIDQVAGPAPTPEITSKLSSTPTIMNPVVVPNLRTLRFIVRAAIHERRTRQTNNQGSKEQEDILEWSKQFFRAFGLRGTRLAEEIQQPYVEEEEQERPTLTMEKRMYDQARAKLGLKERRPVEVRKKFKSAKLVSKVDGLLDLSTVRREKAMFRHFRPQYLEARPGTKTKRPEPEDDSHGQHPLDRPAISPEGEFESEQLRKWKWL